VFITGAARIYDFSLRKRVASCRARLWHMSQCSVDCILRFSVFQSDSILQLMGKHARLTAREHTVAQLTAVRLSNKAIAFELGLYVGTVKVHMHSIFQKLNISTRWDLIAPGQMPSTPPEDVAA
jgi:DNA-binding NarL/FixJ family response regulator